MDQTAHRELLSQLIKLDTVGGHEESLARFLKAYLNNYQIDSQLIEVEPDRYNLVAEIGDPRKPVLALEGHQDVVALGDVSKWQHQPLGAEIEGTRMYGRGTSDMKAGLAAEIIAMVELAHTDYFQGHVRLLATIGEESSEVNHMQGAQYFAQHGYVNDVAGVIVAEPSGVPNNWLQQKPPTNPFLFSESQIKQLLANNQTTEQFVLDYAHKGSITYSIVSNGKTAHSSTPELGIDAIAPLIKMYQQQATYFNHFSAINPVLGKCIAVVTKFSGGDQLNSVPAHAEMFVKVRTIPEISNDVIIAHLKTMIGNLNDAGQAQLTFNLLGNKTPVQSNPDDKLISLLHQIGEEELHEQLPVGGSSAGTDASELIRANPNMTVAIFGPGNMTAHQIDEYVDLTNFEHFITIYKRVIQAYFK